MEILHEHGFTGIRIQKSLLTASMPADPDATRGRIPPRTCTFVLNTLSGILHFAYR
jgi:hypothetical protein